MMGLDFIVIIGLLTVANCAWEYTYHSHPVIYQNATETCTKHGAYVLSPRSVDDMKEVQQFWSSQTVDFPVWLGLTVHRLSFAAFEHRWLDKDPLTWGSWAYTEPNDLRYDKCVVSKETGVWHTRSCDDRYAIICQKNGPISTNDLTFYGQYFVRVLDAVPNTPSTREVSARGIHYCIAFCQQESTCDVILFNTNGTCLLYPHDVDMVTSIQNNRDSVYRRRRL